MTDLPTFTAFSGHRCVAQGGLREMARVVAQAGEPVLVFDDRDGRVVDLDLSHGPEAAADEHAARTAAPEAESPPPRSGRGRPRLGVVAREVTLLPRHWAWLAEQPGGASAALRRLVEAARRDGADADRGRKARDAAYHAMTTLAGDLPGYEEATRALFAGDAERVRRLSAAWPGDVAAYVARLAAG